MPFRHSPAVVAAALLLPALVFAPPPAGADIPDGHVSPVVIAAEAGDTAHCPRHTVVRGETLSILADRYYGDIFASGRIHAANADVIGRNPNLIEPGIRLVIPCTDGDAAPVIAAEEEDDASAGAEMAPAEAAAAATNVSTPAMPGSAAGLAPLPQAEAGPGPGPVAEVPDAVTDAIQAAPPPTEIFVLTGAPYLPFVDPEDEGGGMLTELVLAAFAETEGPPVRIGFVNDRPAHLDIILPRGGFSFSFPWLIPDCTSGRLTPEQAALCTRFLASDSLYEHVTEFYARADSRFENARRMADLAGARICRPAGYPVDDLVLAELLPGAAELVRRRSPRGCLAALDAGEVDIVSVDGALARAIVTQMRPENPILVLEGLTRIDRLHAVSLRGDAAGEAAVDRLNAGLAILVETGLWYRIVERHLHRS